jgi:hypothetical protein
VGRDKVGGVRSALLGEAEGCGVGLPRIYVGASEGGSVGCATGCNDGSGVGTATDTKVTVKVGVVTVTEVPPPSAVLIAVFSTLAPVAIGAKLGATVTFVVPPEEIVTFNGSKSQSPPFPLGADASTLPKAWRLFLEDVSTKPPFPLNDPPRAEISP